MPRRVGVRCRLVMARICLTTCSSEMLRMPTVWRRKSSSRLMLRVRLLQKMRGWMVKCSSYQTMRYVTYNPVDDPVWLQLLRSLTEKQPWKFWNFVRAFGTAAGCGVPKEQVKVIPTWLYYAMAVIAEWGVWMFAFRSRESQLNRKMIGFFTMTTPSRSARPRYGSDIDRSGQHNRE
jgi:hypothetical protein